VTGPPSSRTIYKRHDRAREEVRRLLAAIFSAELTQPSSEVWLVSPWIRNVVVLDNQGGDFAALDVTWGQREIRLFDCLASLVARGGRVRLKTSRDRASQDLVAALTRRARDLEVADHLQVSVSDRLHTKGLLTDRCLIRGSMNFTLRGVEFNEEAVTYDIDPASIAEMRISLDEQW
jgi:phosphatidylserine/phosphatidylglycerophosphate/cardiolipin synthase-like enzyme